MRGWIFLGTVSLTLALPFLSFSVFGAEYEMVPEGRWLLLASLNADRHERSITTYNEDGTLKEYLIPDNDVRSQITGEVSRDILQASLRIGFGVSDTWNINLDASYWRIDQESNLATASANSEVLAQVSRLQSRTVSGPGRLVLTSLHRAVFSDRYGLIWGYGFAQPLDEPQSRYAGRGSLYAGSPFQEVFGLIQQTFYTFTIKGRVDLRGKIGLSINRELELLSGGNASVNPGNYGEFFAGWEQYIGALFWGAGVSQTIWGQSRISGGKQGDTVQSTDVGLSLGFGNLDRLEEEPIPHPYLFYLQYEKTVEGLNTPIKSLVQLTVRTYF